MRTTKILIAALLALGAPALAAATDAPHDPSSGSFANNCQTCHQLHNSLGASLTQQATISDACITCHSTYIGTRPGFAWSSVTDQAVAGVSGAHHRWDAAAVNAAVGATTPNDPEMAKRLVGGNLECSVCHNQHAAGKAKAPPSTMHTSFTVGTLYPETNPGGGTATLTLVSAGPDAVAKGYRVRVVSAANLAVSHDGGLSWFKPSAPAGGTWSADTAIPAGGPFTAGTIMTLDDPDVTIRLAAGATVGDYWDFYISFPFLRAPSQNGELCLACHQDRAMDHTQVRAGGDGVKLFSHPVNAALNANGMGYDRTVATVLDADGGNQVGGGDANATNDLVLGPGGVVGCTSCHAAHNADSNSLTVDPR